MTPAQHHGAEQFAADPANGRLTRREALTRLAQLGVSATATALVAACTAGGSGRRRRSRTRK